MKKTIVIIILISIMAMMLPVLSQAAITPFFIAVNDTLLPFNNDTMPYVVGGEYFIPHGVFRGVGVWSIASTEYVRLYTGANQYVDFYTSGGTVIDQDGATLSWPAARRVSGRIYVPLRQISEFFGFSYQIQSVGRDIIPQEQMWVIRMLSADGSAWINWQTFFGIYGTTLRNAYNDYFSPATSSSPSPSPGGDVSASPPTVEPPPIYDDVTIHHSFYDISAGGGEAILDLLDSYSGEFDQFCFYVSEIDIRSNPGIIRKVSSEGYTIGIWLLEGTLDEYLRVSSLLFEATKIKTMIVSSDFEIEVETARLNRYGVIYWDSKESLIYDDTFSVEAVTEMLPQESGERKNLLSVCSEFTALMLVDILSYLLEYEYMVEGITETTVPLLRSISQE